MYLAVCLAARESRLSRASEPAKLTCHLEVVSRGMTFAGNRNLNGKLT